MLIVGAGMLGAACAREFARQGLSVAVIESGAVAGGASAAAMGHLLLVDAEGAAPGSAAEAEYRLSRRSLALWRDWLAEAPDHKELAEHADCGTLWVATDDEELALARRKQAWLCARGHEARLLDPAELARCEPLLRPGLAGALLLPGDGRVYPPRVAARWLEDAGATLIRAEVAALEPGGGVRLADGRRLWGALVLLCAGLASQRWLPPGSLIPRKGQLAITERQPGPALRHQLVELGYLAKAHLADRDSVSFNVQPRPGGQVLIGSSRQPGRADSALDPALLSRMLALAASHLPGMAQHRLLRAWTGLRPATGDGLPLIGAHPALKRCWVATGHEGLGITTAPASAELIAALSLGQPLPEGAPDMSTLAPARFA